MKPFRALVCAAALAAAGALFGACYTSPNAVSGASVTLSPDLDNGGSLPPGAPLIVVPSESGSAARLAAAMAAKLGARVASPAVLDSDDVAAAPLIGFGSGIMDQVHHRAVLAFAESLPPSPGKRAFIFSASGVSQEGARRMKVEDPHAALRGILSAKGFVIADEFNCEGFNDNSFLILFGGMNKGRPNADDLARAESFAIGLRAAGVN